jgi:hypothetical protein
MVGNPSTSRSPPSTGDGASGDVAMSKSEALLSLSTNMTVMALESDVVPPPDDDEVVVSCCRAPEEEEEDDGGG